MANLETLELTINANAQSASQGLSGLINSLSALSKGVGKSVSGLRQLNAELAKLKTNSGIKMPTMSATPGQTTGIRKTTKSIQEQIKAIREWQEAGRANRTFSHHLDNYSEDYARQKSPQWFNQPAYGSKEWKDMVVARNEALKANGGKESIVRDPKTLSFFRDSAKWIGLLGKNSQESEEKVGGFKEKFGKFAEGAKEVTGKIKDLVPRFGALNRVMRIASTMLIRMGVRALFKGIKEGFDNYYQYSKLTGGVFANEMDRISSAWSQLKNQMGAAIAPAITAAIPAINALGSAAIYAFNALSQLLALLSGSGTWTKASAGVSEYAAAVNDATGGGGGGGMKELLADFDELNVIAQESGGGGGGKAGQTAEELMNMFEEVGEFEGWIKDLVGWLEEHLPVVNGLVAALASGLLGLPLSISIGIGITVTGLSMSYDAGKDMGKNGITADNIFELIKGEILSGLGGAITGASIAHLVPGASAATGAMIGLTIGLAISLVVFSIGVEEGYRERAYGDLEFSRSEIEKAVREVYHFEASPEIDVTSVKITGLEEAKKNVETDLEELKTVYLTAKLEGFNQDTVEAIARKVKQLVSHTQDYIRGMKEYTVYIDAQLKEVTDPTLLKGFDTLSGIIGELGTQIGDILSDNVVEEFEKGTLDKLMGSLTRITSAVTNAQKGEEYIGQSYEIRSAFTNGDLNKESFESYMNAIEELNTTTMNTAKQAISKDAENIASLIAGLEQAKEEGYETWNGKNIDDELKAARDEYAKYDTPEKRNQAAKDLYDIWVGNQTVEQGKDIISGYQSVLDNLGTNVGMKEYLTTNRDRLKYNADEFNDILLETVAHMTGQDKKIVVNASELFDITGWDMLSDGLRENLFNVLHENLKYSWEDSIKLVKDTYKLNIGELLDGIGFEKMPKKQQKYIASIIASLFDTKEIKKYVEESGTELGDIFGDALNEALEDKKKNELTDMLDEYTKAFEVSGKEITNIIDNQWAFVSPMIDTMGTTESLAYIIEAVKNGGENAEYIIKRWALVSPVIQTKGTELAVQYFNESLKLWGSDAELIIKNWDLIAPMIDDKRVKDSLMNLNYFMQRTGVDLGVVIGNWKLIAPTIETLGYDNSLHLMKEISRQTGIELQELIENWNLITPYIDYDDTEKSAKEISNLINKDVKNWQETLKGELKTSNVETPYGFGNNAKKLAEKSYYEISNIISGLLETSKVKTPNGFGEGVGRSAEAIYTSIKKTVGGNLTVSNISIPSGFGSDVKDKAAKAFKTISDEINKKVDVKVSVDEGTSEKDAKDIFKKIKKVFEKAVECVIEVTTVAASTTDAAGSTKDATKTTETTSTTTSLTDSTKDFLKGLGLFATGAYSIPSGDLFVANEHGAELVGSINGHTSVANQDQIVEGIQRGVAEANSEQNALLRQQNELLMGILEKDMTVDFGASASFGRVAKQSIDMYAGMVGG